MSELLSMDLSRKESNGDTDEINKHYDLADEFIE